MTSVECGKVDTIFSQKKKFSNQSHNLPISFSLNRFARRPFSEYTSVDSNRSSSLKTVARPPLIINSLIATLRQMRRIQR